MTTKFEDQLLSLNYFEVPTLQKKCKKSKLTLVIKIMGCKPRNGNTHYFEIDIKEIKTYKPLGNYNTLEDTANNTLEELIEVFNNSVWDVRNGRFTTQQQVENSQKDVDLTNYLKEKLHIDASDYDDKCSVCFEDCAYKTKCGHVICLLCFQKFEKDECSICRKTTPFQCNRCTMNNGMDNYHTQCECDVANDIELDIEEDEDEDEYELVKNSFPEHKFSIAMNMAELEEVVCESTKITIKDERSCGCYDDAERPETKIYEIESDRMTNRRIIESLISQGLELECDHHFIEGFHKIDKNLYEICTGS